MGLNSQRLWALILSALGSATSKCRTSFVSFHRTLGISSAMKTTISCFIHVLPCLLIAGTTAQASVRINALPTINLPTNNTDNSQGSIAYHPGFDQYYGGNAGTASGPGYVWSSTGTLLQSTSSSNVDFRSLNYNPATNAIEVVTFAARLNSSSNRGLITMGLQGTGLYNGANSVALAMVPGLIGNQTMPAYNPSTNQLYSADNVLSPGTINVVSRATGAGTGVINLDLAAAGVSPSSLTSYSINYDPVNDALISFDYVGDQALVFDLSGAFLGASQLPAFPSSSAYSVGYANEQLFVYDTSAGAYRGFDIFAANAGAVPEPTSLIVWGLLGAVGLKRRRA